MSLASIEQLLKKHMGLNAASIGSSAIKRAVQMRMQARAINTTEEYLQRLHGSNAELDELVELIVVPETWFYRDGKPFEALAAFAREHWRTRSPAKPLRLLSIPCSTGEEPYTIAMTLLDAGLAPDSIQIDAVDISASNLRRARAGLYREHSFRSDDLSFRNRHFMHNEAGYLLNADIRKCVRFLQDNLLAPGFLAKEPPYNVVFCRNLLIYFDRETQARALDVIERHLEKPGLLFLGHAESGVVAERDYVALKHPRSFAFVYGGERVVEPWTEPHAFELPRRRRAAARPMQPNRKSTPGTTAVPIVPDAASIPATTIPGYLDEATALANGGHLVEAATLCEQHLQKEGPNAQAFYLLALLREAVGEPDEAESYLRKALYLDPGHYEALTHIALLLAQRGDMANAELMRQRAKRSFERQEAARSAGGA